MITMSELGEAAEKSVSGSSKHNENCPGNGYRAAQIQFARALEELILELKQGILSIWMLPSIGVVSAEGPQIIHLQQQPAQHNIEKPQRIPKHTLSSISEEHRSFACYEGYISRQMICRFHS